MLCGRLPCRRQRALHPFASYLENPQRIVRNFEHFYRDQLRHFLRPIWLLHSGLGFRRRGDYRLLRKDDAPAGD